MSNKLKRKRYDLTLTIATILSSMIKYIVQTLQLSLDCRFLSIRGKIEGVKIHIMHIIYKNISYIKYSKQTIYYTTSFVLFKFHLLITFVKI